jgi:hypothetical protein
MEIIMSERIKCTECKNMILKSTSESNNGLCGQCFKQKNNLQTNYTHDYNGHVINEPEDDFDVFLVVDGNKDFLVRATNLAPEFNALQLKKKIVEYKGRLCIPLGPVANSINKGRFLSLASKFNIEVILE